MKNVKNKNKLKYKIIIIFAVLIFAAGIAGSIVVLNAPKKNTVIIKSDGKILYTLDLSSEPDRTFEIKTDRGENTVEIKDGKIRVLSADCPDKTCVRMGRLESSAMPIVCLPHKLVIEFAENDDGVDAITE